jgi:hypothetical protein
LFYISEWRQRWFEWVSDLLYIQVKAMEIIPLLGVLCKIKNKALCLSVTKYQGLHGWTQFLEIPRGELSLEVIGKF